MTPSAGEQVESLYSLVSAVLELARQGAEEQLPPAIERLRSATEQVQALPPEVLAEHADRLAEIHRQHSQLCLCLAQKKQELADQLSRLAQGRRSLRAYGG